MSQLIFPVTKKEAEKKGVRYSSEENRNAIFPSRLRLLREESGVSQATLAAKLGISKSTLGLYETGDTLPDAKTLYDMAKYFKVSADYLLNISAERSADPDIKGVCEYTGLSNEAVIAISFDMKKKNSRPLAKVMDYFIKEFYLSFISVNLWNGIKDSATARAATQANMPDVVEDRARFNKWRFLSVCETAYDKLEKELENLLQEEVEESIHLGLDELQREAETRLERIQELRNGLQQ